MRGKADYDPESIFEGNLFFLLHDIIDIFFFFIGLAVFFLLFVSYD